MWVDLGRGQGSIDGERFRIVMDCLGAVVLVVKQGAQLIVGPGVLGFQLEDRVQGLLRRLCSTLLHQYQGQIVERGDVVGVDFERSEIDLFRFFQIARQGQQVTQVVEKIGV